MPLSTSPRRDLHPPIEPNRSGRLRVSPIHELYWEESGNPQGIPVVFLHGGPGVGIGANNRRFFAARDWRVILFDQRGAGRSTPLASVEENTTTHLIGDIERLREHLGIERWLVFGGSWGSFLSIAYGEAHPERCLGFILRGIFLGRPQEVDWFVHGMATFFPESHRRFIEALPEHERGQPLAHYYRRLTDASPGVHLPAARVWSAYEGSCLSLLPDPDTVAVFIRDEQALPLARLEAHYMIHNLFQPPGGLLARIDRIRHLPGVIVQGRYDVICPPGSADALAQAWPEAAYHIVPDAGHSALEPGIRTQLLDALDSLRHRLEA